MPYIGRSTDGFGVRNRFLYLASADDTSVSGADANGATLTFTDGAYVDVYLNGVLLKAGTDYNTNTANTIAGLSALAANDEVTVIVYDVFTVGDMVSATSGGTFNSGVTIKTSDNSNTLRLTSTDADADVGPSLNLYRNSGSPADGDSIGDIEFDGRNDASEDVRYARIRGRIDDASDGTEDSKLIFEVIAAGSQQEAVRFEPSGVVFNESSNDVDFRVESNGNTHMLFVDGGNDKVMIGLETPDVFNGTTPPLQIEGTDNNKASLSITRNSNDNGQPLLILSKSRGTSVNSDTILQDNDVVGEIVFLGADGNDRNSQVATIQATVDGTPGSNDMPGALSFRTTADGAATSTERMRIDSSGKVGIGTTNPLHDLQINTAAPEIQLEETSSGGSKRLSLGVESDGTPFISAEQSGGQIEIQLSGNNEFQFLNGGRFRVTRTGVPAYISRGPVTGVTVDAGSTTSVAGMSGVLYNLVLVSTGGGYGAVYSMGYHSTVNLIHGTGAFSASSGTSSSSNVYKSSASHTITLQNNTSSAISYYILILSSYD